MKPESNVESEVDLVLHQLWRATGKVRYAIFLLLGAEVFSIWASRQHPYLVMLAMTTATLFLVWPMLDMGLRRRKRPLTVVLWIRSFHRGSRSRGFVRLWHSAVAPWGQVLTLADTDVQIPRDTIAYVLATILAVIAVELLALARRHALAQIPVKDIVLYASLCLLVGGATVYVAIRRTAIKILNMDHVDDVRRHTRRIHAEKMFMWMMGPKTIQCPRSDDLVWRETIHTLAPEVGVVIVDVGEGHSVNFDWEIQTLLAICGHNKVILAIPESISRNVEELRALQSAAILQRLPSAATTPIIFYPNTIPWFKLGRKFQALLRPAQRIVGIAALAVAERFPDAALPSAKLTV